MATDLDLEEGETLVRSGVARAQRVGRFLPAGMTAEGTLYLTSRRLVWTRSLMNIPFWGGPQSFEVRLSDVEGCSLRSRGFVVKVGDTRYLFMTARWLLIPLSRKPAEAWRDAIAGTLGS